MASSFDDLTKASIGGWLLESSCNADPQLAPALIAQTSSSLPAIMGDVSLLSGRSPANWLVLVVCLSRLSIQISQLRTW